MTRKEAIITGVAGLSALPMAAPAARAEDSKGENREVEKIRALLKAHDEAMTNHDLNGVMACLTEKAAIMGTGPGEIWVGPQAIKVAYEHFSKASTKESRILNISLRLAASAPTWAGSWHPEM
jgi:hypothetical protein